MIAVLTLALLALKDINSTDHFVPYEISAEKNTPPVNRPVITIIPY